MKSVSSLLLSVALMSLSTVAFAQSDAPKSSALTDAPKPSAAPDAPKAVPQSEAQKSFDKLKTLAGTWQGPVTTDPPQPEMGNGAHTQVSLRVTSRGNALVHEMKEAGTPDDPARYDHPVTMFYLDSDRLLLTHYCDVGNRPRMTGKMSPDGKTVEFEFLDVAGGTESGHMYHAAFTIVDTNHHIEDWTYMMPGDKPVHARFDLERAQ